MSTKSEIKKGNVIQGPFPGKRKEFRLKFLSYMSLYQILTVACVLALFCILPATAVFVYFSYWKGATITLTVACSFMFVLLALEFRQRKDLEESIAQSSRD